MSMIYRKITLIAILVMCYGMAYAEVDSGTGQQSTDTTPSMIAWILSWWPF